MQPSDVLAPVRQLLVDAGRPVSVRRLWNQASEGGELDGAVADVAALRALLEAEGDAAGITQVRKGVFAVGEPARAEGDGAREKPRKRRKAPTALEMAGDSPVIALSVEEAIAAVGANSDLGALRRRLWDRMRAHAALVVADGGTEDLDVDDEVQPKKRRRRGARAKPQATVAAPELIEAEAALDEVEEPPKKAKKKKKADAKKSNAKKSEDKSGDKKADAKKADTKKAKKGPKKKKANAVAEAAAQAIREAGKPLSVAALNRRLTLEGASTQAAVRAAIEATVTEREAAGLRSPFAQLDSGAVALTEWGVSARYLALEATIEQALAEQREIVLRSLLERTGAASPEGFEQVALALLTRMGFKELEVLHRSGANVALAGQCGDDRRAIVAQRSLTAVGAETIEAIRASLPHFTATSALVLTMGGYEADAQAAAAGEPLVELVDGPGWAALLYDHGVGVQTHQPTVRYLDGAFFDALSP